MVGKRVVVLLDGTWNNLPDNTSVWRLCQLIAPEDAAGLPQKIYYSSGVGTAHGRRVIGGAFGYGLSDEVSKAYRWLMGNYDQGDQVFLFGFSRGAFTARSLAGMIARCGLLRPGSPLSVEELYERYRLEDDAPSLVDLYRTRGLPPAARRLLRHSRRIPIKMIGVWDTVGALGVPFGNIPGISRKRFGFHNTSLSTLFEHAYHALAIDEHRAPFSPTLWSKFVPTELDQPKKRRTRASIIEQRWFAGSHANVGGGNGGDDMPQLPLAWLMAKAGNLGLAYRGAVEPRGHERFGDIEDSFSSFLFGTYKLIRIGKRHYRPIADDAVEVVGGKVSSVGETIDASVFDRWRKYKTYRPLNLLDWANRKGVDVAKMRATVCAHTGLPLFADSDIAPSA
jgi:uncharacterized protein (DUF2235 family)